MPPKKEDFAYLWDMLDYSKSIIQFISGKSFEEYSNNRMLRAAVERNLEIIGESARNISEHFKSSHPEIPWRQIIAQRNVLIHEYGEIKNERIWKVATLNIPELVARIEPLIPPNPDNM